MTNPFIGQITLFAGNFAPRAFAFCEGQLLAISSNTALFSILGTTYGGDGRTTFALPDLRGRVSVSSGRGPGLSTYKLGQRSGIEEVTLNLLQLPSHGHLASSVSHLNGQSAPGDDDTISNGTTISSGTNTSTEIFSSSGTVNTLMNASSVLSSTTTDFTGGSQPHENRRPFLALNYIIAMQGTYPSRS